MDELKVFLSSPGDLSSDIKSLKDLLIQFSKYTEKTYNVRIIPQTGEDAERGPQRPQKLINELLDRCDFFIGMMGKIYGSPTGLAESGTDEEFKFVFNKFELKQKPQVKMFFKQVNESILDKNERKEYRKVKELMERIRTNFYFDKYEEIEEVIQIVLEKIKEYIIQLPEIKEFRASHSQVKSGEGITLSYNVKNAILPLKLERFYKDGSDYSDYNLKYSNGERGDGVVIKDTLYRLTASNEFGKRSKECEVDVIRDANKAKATSGPITSILAKTENTLLKTSEVMKEAECIRKAKILFTRINEHLVDIDNERKRNDGSTFIIESIGPNKYITGPNSIKILASHFTVIRSEIYDSQVIITFRVGIKGAECHLYKSIHKLVKGERPPWIMVINWEKVLTFVPKSNLQKTIVDDSFQESLRKGLEIISKDISDQEDI